MANEIHPQTAQQGEIILYQPDETVRFEVSTEDDAVWLTQLDKRADGINRISDSMEVN